MVPGVNKRTYVSALRAERARATRSAVLRAAVDLYLAHGYPSTSIAAVAKRAGVSADTVYHLFTTKRRLLQEAVDTVIGGDDADIPLLERADPQALRRETDQRRQVALFSAGISRQLDRVRPVDDMLRSAAAVDPEIAALRADIQLRQRREAMRVIAGWIADRGPLRDGLSAEDAAAVLWTSTSPEVHSMFRVDWTWTSAQYETWLRVTVESNLLPPP